MDQQECKRQQKLKLKQILQHLRLLDQKEQEMQHFFDTQNSKHTQYFQDMRYFMDRQKFLDTQQYLEMKYQLNMMHSHYMRLRQPVQMADQPQPQSTPVYPAPHPPNNSQRYIFDYGTVLTHGNSSAVMARSPSTSSVDQESCTSQEENRPISDVLRDVHNEIRRNNEAPDSSQNSVPNSIGQRGIASPVMANVLNTSTADSCTSQEENSPTPDHQEDEAVNESRDVRISRHDILKIRGALVNLNSVVKDLREENAKLKHILSIKSQEEDIESYLEEIRQRVQNNLENQVSDSSQGSVQNSAGQG